MTSEGFPAGLQKGENLIGVLVNQATKNRHDDDLDIQPQRPVFDVIQVMLDTGMQAGVAAPAMHLRPAGKPGLDQVFLVVMRGTL